MNIFEDLIDELKEENLLETVVDTGKVKAEKTETPNPKKLNAESSKEDSPVAIENPEDNLESNSEIFETAPQTLNQPIDEANYYRKRAMEEVAFLQMVEYVFAGVEREQMKIAPKPYDDLEVKKVLHAFLQVSGDVKSPEHASLEFRLMQETESWYSALSHRDKRVSVAHLRRFCETTRPPLSSPALIALGRFYRNAPFSEPVRNKFDLVLTKLFTKDAGGEKRSMVFSREELIRHLNELYADWSSIPLYATDEDDSSILLTALKFEDFMAETGAAENFDELVRNDFFNRVRAFKESTNEQFFAPLVTAAAIESNVRIGNRYVELLDIERAQGEQAKLEDKYGFLHDQVISDATSKTLQLAELLKERIEKSEPAGEHKEAASVKTPSKSKNETIVKSGKKDRSGFLAVNKWLLAATVVALVVSFSLYFWANSQDAPEKVSQNVKKINLENSLLQEYIGEARITNETFFGVVLPSWSSLSREKKEEILKKIVSIGADKGFRNVHLLDKEGKTAASASKENLTVSSL